MKTRTRFALDDSPGSAFRSPAFIPTTCRRSTRPRRSLIRAITILPRLASDSAERTWWKRCGSSALVKRRELPAAKLAELLNPARRETLHAFDLRKVIRLLNKLIVLHAKRLAKAITLK